MGHTSRNKADPNLIGFCCSKSCLSSFWANSSPQEANPLHQCLLERARTIATTAVAIAPAAAAPKAAPVAKSESLKRRDDAPATRPGLRNKAPIKGSTPAWASGTVAAVHEPDNTKRYAKPRVGHTVRAGMR